MKYGFFLTALIATAFLLVFTEHTSSSVPVGKAAAQGAVSERTLHGDTFPVDPDTRECVEVSRSRTYTTPEGYTYDVPVRLIKCSESPEPKLEYIYGPDRRYSPSSINEEVTTRNDREY